MLVSRRPSPRTPDRSEIDGHTLVELAAVLLIGSLALAAGLPAVGAQRDRWAVSGAREAVVGAVSSARAEAVRRGGASVLLDPVGDSLRVESVAGTGETVDVRADFGVDLGPGDRAFRVRFGPLGLGRVASRTIVLRRGDAAASLTISSYGRIRRW